MQLTPSVQITENLLKNENYVKTAYGEIAAFVGHFEKGPIGIPTYITTIKSFVATFGDGVGDTYNDWYQVYNYLSYASGIWVTRESGVNRVNASNNTLKLAVNNQEDWLVQEPNIAVGPQLPVAFFAKTPGTWGNDITVAMITKAEYDLNVVLGHGITAQQAFAFVRVDHFGVCIFKNGVVVETFHKPAGLLAELNLQSAFVYVKYDSFNLPKPIVNLVDFAANSGQLNMQTLTNTRSVDNLQPQVGNVQVGVNLGLLTGTYDFAPFVFYGSTLMYLTGGVNDIPRYVELLDAYTTYEDTGFYDLDIIIGNERANGIAIAVAEVRRDCLAFIGYPTSLIERVIQPYFASTPLTGTNAISFIPNYAYQIKQLNLSEFQSVKDYASSIPNSMFAYFMVDVKVQFDKFSSRAKIINLAGDCAGLKAKASLTNPWIPGAGMTYGVLKNLNCTFLKMSASQREELYALGLNLTKSKIIDTQKTYIVQPTSFNRVNVRSMFNHIEKDIRKIMVNQLFSLNTLANQDTIAKQITTYLDDVKAARGLADFRVLVGTDPQNPNAIIADIVVKPMFVAEIIKLVMNNTGTANINVVV